MSRLKERQERERAIIESYEKTIKNSKKTLQQISKEKKRKKKTVEELQQSISFDGIRKYMIRNPDDYKVKSCNYDRQVCGLIDHVFVKYRVPDFMYGALLAQKHQFARMNEQYKKWFIALAQGQSLAKLTKPYMTAKETHVFTKMGYTDQIHHNIWKAKMKVAGVPNSVMLKLIERIYANKNPEALTNDNTKLVDVILFFARYYKEFDVNTCNEVIDFVGWKLNNDPEFSFKGRTASSMIALSNEWHVLIQKAKLGSNIEWEGMGITKWEHRDKMYVWTMHELLNNKELMNEGRKQKHCVYSYVNSCKEGYCSIFSLRAHHYHLVQKDTPANDEDAIEYLIGDEVTRITVEIRRRQLVQIRGGGNRLIEPFEKQILRLWAGEKGLSM